MAGIIENVRTGSQTDNNYNSIVNSYIDRSDPATESFIRSGLAGAISRSGSCIVFYNASINIFYLTTLFE